jgi:hypothetical protein
VLVPKSVHILMQWKHVEVADAFVEKAKGHMKQGDLFDE